MKFTEVGDPASNLSPMRWVLKFTINNLINLFFGFSIYQYINMETYGLKKKPTLKELITQIETEPNTIKYPDRTATFVRNSFELSQLDGEGMREMEQQQAQQMAEVAKENAIRNLSKHSDVPHADLSEKAKAATRGQSVQTMLKHRQAQDHKPHNQHRQAQDHDPTTSTDKRWSTHNTRI